MAALLVGLCGATAACADPAQLAKGRICADDVKARRPPPPDCGLPPP